MLLYTFLDISNAYNNVWRDDLWHKMRQYGVEENFCMSAKDYNAVEARIVSEEAEVVRDR